MPAKIGAGNLWRIDRFNAALRRFVRKFTDARGRKKTFVSLARFDVYPRNNKFIGFYYERSSINKI